MSDTHSVSPGPRDRELFLAALELPADEREAFLIAQCGSDSNRREHVLSLLREHQSDSGFLDQPAVARDGNAKYGTGGTLLSTSNTGQGATAIGERIGRYKLLQQIGEGGCGVVYMAEQEEPVRRRVALKIIKLGMDTRGVIARFEAERQALAMMDHPNIARVLDGGTTETGRPYFVMELVRGIKITEYADQSNLATADRLQLFIQVCNAIQHAHQKGIIHRDIKPSNILVTLHDGVPVPKVIDFGIAKAIEQKLTDKTLFTQFQSFIGTPAYMSPEQAEMSGLDIDTRSDIYSLGVLLYELLTGQTPFDPEALISKGIDECRRTIREKEPARPSTRLATMLAADLTTTAQQRRTEGNRLIHLMQGDLDWIAMKCLEKDRSRRYDTAVGLATDIQRYLNNEAVLARPPSNIYRLKKFLRKHRGPVSAAAAIAVILIVGTTVSTWLAIRATIAQEAAKMNAADAQKQARRAEQEKQAARLNEYVADVSLAQQSLKDGNLAKAVQLLEKHLPIEGEPDLRGFEWRYLWEQSKGDPHESLPRQERAITALATAPNGRWLAVAAGRNITVWDLATKSMVANVPTQMVRPPNDQGEPTDKPPGERPSRRPPSFRFGGYDALEFADDGKILVAASRGSLRRWRTDTWTELEMLRDLTLPVAVSPNGELMAAGRRIRGKPDDNTLVILNTKDWSSVATLPGENQVAFSPDSKRVAADSKEGITIWNLDHSSPPLVLENSTNVFGRGGLGRSSDHNLAFSHDGRQIAAPRNTPTALGVFVVSIWDARTGAEERTLPKQPEQIEHTGFISAIAFSPNEMLLATASMDHSIRLWDVADDPARPQAQRPTVLEGHLNEVWNLTFTQDGKELVSGAKDGTIKIWPTHPLPRQDTFTGLGQPLGFSGDSRTLASIAPAGNNSVITFFNFATREPIKAFTLGADQWFGGHERQPFALSTDLGTLVQAYGDRTIKFWKTVGDEAKSLPSSDRPVDSLAVSPDGRYAVGTSRGQMATWWDIGANTRTNWDIYARAFVFSPDGRFVVSFPPDEGTPTPPQIWNVPTRTLRMTLNSTESNEGYFAAVVSPNGKRLAVTYSDHTIGIWDTESGKMLGLCTGHKQPAFSIAFSPDSRTLASAGADSTLRLWNVETQQELMVDRQLGDAMNNLEFSPDGQYLVGAYGSPDSSTIRIFSAPAVSEAEIKSRLVAQQAGVN